MKPFIPTADQFLRLTEDWTFTPTKGGYDEGFWLTHVVALLNDLNHDWQAATAKINAGDPVTIPKGTIIRVTGIRITKKHADKSPAMVRVMSSPDLRIAMKKYGGTAMYGVNFNVPVRVLQEAEVEIIE